MQQGYGYFQFVGSDLPSGHRSDGRARHSVRAVPGFTTNDDGQKAVGLTSSYHGVQRTACPTTDWPRSFLFSRLLQGVQDDSRSKDFRQHNRTLFRILGIN